MPIVHLKTTEFEATVRKPGILIIDFSAAWCGPCRAFAPTFEAAAERHADVTWAEVDTEAEPALAEALQIQAIPTLMVLRDGVLILRQLGVVPAAALDLIVEKVGALDMDGIRAELAAEQPHPGA